MRIVFFSEAYEPQVNGVVTTLGKLVDHLRECGHQVLLAVPRFNGRLTRTGVVEFRALPFPPYPEVPFILPHWRFHRREFAQVEAFKPDLVHLMSPAVMAYFGQIWARRRGCPVVASYETDLIGYMHYYHVGMFKAPVWRYFRWLFNNCLRTYVPSLDTKKLLEANGICRVDVFDRGVDCVHFHPSRRSEPLRKSLGIEAGGILLLYVGRISKEKNLQLLLNWFLSSCSRYPNMRLVITGDGPLRGRMAREFSDPRIIFNGWKKGQELATLFASADIFTLPSSTETLSLVAMEAMACGVPVVAMNAGGVRNVVEHQSTGLLAGSGLEFEVFLQRLIEDAGLRSQLGRNARHYAEKKTWAHAFEDLKRSYQEVLSEKHGTHA
jgi:phosphatidylinositol alpha 1,6-mannosyltransferase